MSKGVVPYSDIFRHRLHVHGNYIIIFQIWKGVLLAIYGFGVTGFFLRKSGHQGKSEEILTRLLHDYDGLALWS